MINKLKYKCGKYIWIILYIILYYYTHFDFITYLFHKFKLFDFNNKNIIKLLNNYKFLYFK